MRQLNRIKEYIICAAIHYDDGKVYDHQPCNIKTGLVVAGRRHHNCIMTVAILTAKNWRKYAAGMTETQGFLTSRDKFLNRQEAWKLAVDSKQIKTYEKENVLFSEDLY